MPLRYFPYGYPDKLLENEKMKYVYTFLCLLFKDIKLDFKNLTSVKSFSTTMSTLFTISISFVK